MRTIVLRLLNDLMLCLGHLERCRRPMSAMGVVIVSLVVTWIVYVPIHELLHAGGCLVTGGEVTELQIGPWYGGTLLEGRISFVKAGGEYAGRLSGFDTKGSDLIYLATVFAPYLLTVLIGLPLIRACTRKWRPLTLGAAVVIGLAPFYNIFGDYFEMGSIIVTRAVSAVGLGADSPAYESLRSDDVFKLIGELVMKPETLALSGAADVALAALIVVLSFVLGIVLAILTYALGDQFARLVLRFPATSPPASADS